MGHVCPRAGVWQRVERGTMTTSVLTLRSAIRLFTAATAVILIAAGLTTRRTLDAQSTSNPVVTENALAGNPQSEWDVQGSGEPSLQGFATDISVNKGGVVSFKIKTTAPGFF